MTDMSDEVWVGYFWSRMSFLNVEESSARRLIVEAQVYATFIPHPGMPVRS